MFRFYVLIFFKNGDTIQGGTLFKEIRYVLQDECIYNAIYFSRWLHEINQNCDEVTRILVGNKCDDPDRRVVLKEDAMRFANQMGIQLFETSAKENINVEEMFRAKTNLLSKS